MEAGQEFEEQVRGELDELTEEKERPNFDRYFMNQADLTAQGERLGDTFNAAERAFEEEKHKMNPIEEMWHKLYQNYDENGRSWRRSCSGSGRKASKTTNSFRMPRSWRSTGRVQRNAGFPVPKPHGPVRVR